ncbi:MAG: hypothetical protein AABY06_02225, partial [Nanoarchaeota archaeon]
MKNKKNLIFRFALFLLFGIILLILNMYFISAKSLNPNDDNKISFIDWLKNSFKFTGNQIEEESLNEIDLAEFNLPENSNIQKVEFGEGISFAKQENLIIFSGKGKIKTQVGSKNQIGKYYEYSLGEDGYLTINSETGQIERAENINLNKNEINLGRVLDNYPPNIRGLKGGKIISYSKEKGLLDVELPDARTIKIESGDNFEIFYANGEIQILNFDATEKTKLEIFEGKFSFEEGGEVSMDKRVLKSSRIIVEKIPNPGKTSFETFVEGQAYKVSGVAIESDVIFFKPGTLDHLGWRGEGDEFSGFLVFDNEGFLSIPASKSAVNQDVIKIDIPAGAQGINRPGISESVYIFSDENIAKASGKNNYIADELLIKDRFLINNAGVGKSGDNFEVSFISRSDYFSEFEEGDRLSFIADETKKGSATFYPETVDDEKMIFEFIPSAEITGEGISVGNDGTDSSWKNGKFIFESNKEKPYSDKSGINLHILAKSGILEDKRVVGVLAVNDGKTLYFDTTTKSKKEVDPTEDFESEYRKIGREAILKEEEIFSPQSLVEGRVRVDTVELLEDPEDFREFLDAKKEIIKYRNINRPVYEKRAHDSKGLIIEKYVDDLKIHIGKGDPLEDFESTRNPFLNSEETKGYEEFAESVLTYQDKRREFEKIGFKSDDFPSVFGNEELKIISEIATSHGISEPEAERFFMTEKNSDGTLKWGVKFGKRLYSLDLDVSTISLWKSYYPKDMRNFEEYKKYYERIVK